MLEASVPGFAEDLVGYQQALAQRNALLRRVRSGQAGEDTLPAWEAPMARFGAQVAAARRAWRRRPARGLRRWSSWGAAPAASCASRRPRRTSPDPRGRPRGVHRTVAGGPPPARDPGGSDPERPHRDDLWIGVRGADLRKEGSQGEQRTAALALLLAARDHLRARSARPILLLDDVLSELDPARRRLLLEAVRDGGQTLVTSADPTAADALGGAFDAVVRVDSGRLDA